MDVTEHKKIAHIFSHASALEEIQRARYLDNACANNPELRNEVDKLLQHSEAGNTQFSAAPNSQRLQKLAQTLTMPATVGPYTLLDILGDGGMAIVYLAQQESPKRLVALKMIKLGMNSEQILRRFDAEREALATMLHKGIATIFDAGLNHDGRSYFVMEYVDGDNIVAFCKKHQLTLQERVKLIIQVCHATTHAHQRGVIHRDLKPSNILVCEENAKPLPKIIDFGIARLMSRPYSDEQALTQHNQVIGTPQYMSPEQANSSIHDTDTRTDVYSIGVVLHELLLGVRPKRLALTGLSASTQPLDSGMRSAQKTLREVSRDELNTLAQERNSNPDELIESLGGDLNWVLYKALQPDRDLRYGSMTALAADLENVLHGRAVSAHPPSRLYQLRCFLRNHMAGVAVTAAIILGLIVSTVGLAIGFNRAEEARLVAESSRLAAVEAQLATERQIELTQLESRRAREVTDFMIELFDVASPAGQRAADLNARELLKRGVNNIQIDLRNQPLVRASLLESMARVYLNLGQYDEAEPLAEEALSLVERESRLVQYQPARIQAYRTRGLTHFYQGEYKHAETKYRKAMELQLSDHPSHTLLFAELKHNLANALFEQGQLEEALGLFREALELRGELLPDQHTKMAESLNSVASAERRLGHLESAMQHYLQALQMRRALGLESHPDTAIILSNLGVTHFNLKRFEQAEAYLLDALNMQRLVFSEDHPQIGTVLANLGATFAASKQLDKAKSTLNDSVAWHQKTLGKDHPNTANALLNLGSVLQQREELNQSEALFRECIAIYRKNASKTPVLGVALANLSETLLRKNKPVEALQLAEESLAQLRAVLPENHPWLFVAKAAVGAAEGANGNTARAHLLLTESLPVLVRTFGEEGTRTLSARDYLRRLDNP